jgi:hypothetical protein
MSFSTRAISTMLINRAVVFALVIAATSVLSSYCLAEDEGETAVLLGTRGIMTQNGRTWQQLDVRAKIMFVNGVQDGATLLLSHIPDSEKAQRAMDAITISGFRFSDIAKQIDLFYSDSANIRIPIVEAYKYALLKMKGSTDTDHDKLLADLRRKYNT